MSIAVWLISTAILWVVVVALTNATEAFVHNYAARVVAMICAGVVAGAAASAIGYTFFLLALLLFARLMWVKRKLAETAASRLRRAGSTPPGDRLGSLAIGFAAAPKGPGCHRIDAEIPPGAMPRRTVP